LDPIDIARKAVTSSLGGLFGRGASPATPMYTKEVGLASGAAGGGAGGGIGTLGKLGLLAEGVTGAIAVFQTQQDQSRRSSDQAAALQAQTNAYLKTNPTADQLRTSLAGVEQGIADLQSNPLNVLVQGDALDRLKAMQ